MKIIDLLNKIANGEEPKNIKIGYWVYDEKYEDLEYEVIHRLADGDFALNSNVEIIEENKGIEKLDIYSCFRAMGVDYTGKLDNNFQNITDKINEIIDRLNNE